MESLPKGLLFWRSFTHWLGGMGFVALYIAIFPLMGVGAMQLFRAEAPGLEMDRLRPRIRSTARILWLIYLGMSVILTALLMAGGMGWFDAVCQMFAAIGTGGFSTKNTSIAWFHSAYIDWVIILFLWIASTNFALWWAVLGGKPKRLLKDPEWRFYSLVLLGSSAVISALVYLQNHVSLHDAIRNATFEVVSTASTTGFATADYEKWAPLAQFIIFMLLFMGGSAGSTAGAMKAVRVYLFAKQALRELFTDRPPAIRGPGAARRSRGGAGGDARHLHVHGSVPARPTSWRSRPCRSPTSTSQRPCRPWQRRWGASARVWRRSAPSTTSCGCTGSPRLSSPSACSPAGSNSSRSC